VETTSNGYLMLLEIEWPLDAMGFFWWFFSFFFFWWKQHQVGWSLNVKSSGHLMLWDSFGGCFVLFFVEITSSNHTCYRILSMVFLIWQHMYVFSFN
jgi:hypothetical protein